MIINFTYLKLLSQVRHPKQRDQLDPFRFLLVFEKIRVMDSLEYKLKAALFQFLALACFHPWSLLIVDWLMGKEVLLQAQIVLIWLLLGLGGLLTFFTYNCIKWSFYYDRKNR